MQLIIFTGILLFLASKLNKFIKKRFNILCIVVAIFSILSYLDSSLDSMINAGFLGLAFFVVVMFQSVFKKGSNLYKKTLSVRKEYSIFGFIFLLPHALIFLIGENQLLEWNGIISFLIMVPLFITSFVIIREKMSVVQWKKIHLLSYIAYILMFVHVIIVSQNVNRLVYIALICLYLFFKIKNNGFRKLDTSSKKLICFTLLILIILVNIIIFIVSNNFFDFSINPFNNDNKYVYATSYEENDKEFLDLTNNLFNDGVHYGEAKGYRWKKVKVNVEIESNIINDIQVIDFGCIGAKYKKFVNKLKDQIVEFQSLDVDTVSGATKSTAGLKTAINNALEKALIKGEEN